MIAPREAVQNAMRRLLGGQVAAAAMRMTAVHQAIAAARCPACTARATRFAGRDGLATCGHGHVWRLRAGAAPTAWHPPPSARPPSAAEIRDGVGYLYVEAAIGREAGEIGANAVKAALDDLSARGARALLLTVDSDGGEAPEALAIFDALRAFSEKTGPVVAHVRRGSSAAGLIALAADYLVVADDGSFLLHRPSGGDGAAEVAEVLDRMTEIYSSRSALTAEELPWTLRRWGEGTRLDPLWALDAGLCDELGNLDRARMLATAAAAGEPFPWSRRRELARRGKG